VIRNLFTTITSRLEEIMKTRKTFSMAICFTVLICSLFIATVNSNAASPATITLSKAYNWKMTAWFPAGHDDNKQLVQFIDTLNKRTNGGVKVTLYESTLGSPNDHWDMVKNNATQLAFLAEGYSVGRMPVSTMFSLPFEFTNMEDMYKVYAEWMKAGYVKELTDNFKILFYKPTSFQHFFFRNKKVTNLEGFKGMKISVLGALQGQVMTALGATGVSMPGGELYMALSTGVIDGTTTGVNNVIGRKFYEVAKYGLQTPVYAGIWVVAVNKETWNSLPKELQVLMEEIGQEVQAAEMKKTIDAQKGFWEAVRKNGMEIYSIPPEEVARLKKATSSEDDKYVAEWSAKGYPVKEALAMMRRITGQK
jgi:TRAP-type C4-dicarboxylate transport system substrate-binding protein